MAVAPVGRRIPIGRSSGGHRWKSTRPNATEESLERTVSTKGAAKKKKSRRFKRAQVAAGTGTSPADGGLAAAASDDRTFEEILRRELDEEEALFGRAAAWTDELRAHLASASQGETTAAITSDNNRLALSGSASESAMPVRMDGVAIGLSAATYSSWSIR